MSALTIVSVDHTIDTIEITAHGLVTGDGFLAVYTATGVIPTGLAAVTDYWAIRVDANHIKLASSSANALSNTPINLTSNGSGTLLLLQGLPYRRPRIAAPLQQVFSADLNSVWLVLVALWNLLTGQAQTVFSATGITLRPLPHGDVTKNVSAASGFGITNFAPTLTGKMVGAGGGGNLVIPIPLVVGERLKSVTLAIFGNGAADVTTFDVTKTTPAQATSSLGSTTVTNPAASWNDTTVTVGSPAALVAGDVVNIALVTNAAGIEFNNVRYTYDRP